MSHAAVSCPMIKTELIAKINLFKQDTSIDIL